MDNYFIFASTEDGSYVEGPVSEKEITSRLESNWYGNVNFLSEMPKLNYGPHGLCIIKGEIVVPKAKEVVIKYTL